MALSAAVLLSTLFLTGSANGHTVNVGVGKTIVVTLSSNASTGYRWRLAAPVDKHVLRVVSHRYIAPTSNRAGAAGKQRWRLRTVGTGKVRFRLVYARPTQRQVTRRFGVTIRVQ